jgi:hypothetical protein
VATDEEAVECIAQFPACGQSIAIPKATGSRRRFCGVSPFVVEFELYRVVIQNVRTLRGSESVETSLVLVYYAKTVRNFTRPEIEVRNVAGELVGIQRHEAFQLRQKLFGNSNGVGGEGSHS